MIPLATYSNLIDLAPAAPPATTAAPSPPTPAALLAAQSLALTSLYAEYVSTLPSTSSTRRSGVPTDWTDQPASSRSQLLRDLLTIRSPDEFGPLSIKVREAVELCLREKERASVDPRVKAETVQNVLETCWKGEQVQLEDAERQALEKVAFWRGDLTRLEGGKVAIVNPANTRMLGCFQPSHLCADNVIHAAAGPRLREDCSEIMNALGTTDVKVADDVLLTKGYTLPAGWVLHVAGPQLRRGEEPSEAEKALLARAYEACLEVAAESGNIDTVAFPCISTGLFAFPAALAASIALSSVISYFKSHPNSALKVIFVLFSAADAGHYISALATRYPALPPPQPVAKHFALPEEVQKWVDEADYVVVHAGAGASADAVKEGLGIGLDYTSKELFKKLYPALLKSTEMLTLYHSIGYQFEDRLVKWAFILAHGNTVLNWGPTPLYTSLLEFLQSKKDYTILTSNADNLFVNSGFDSDKIWTPQGTYAHFQCLKPCRTDSYFEARPWFERAKEFIDPEVMRLPEDRPDLIPTCPNCGGEVFLNVRGGNWFLNTPQHHPTSQKARYKTHLARFLDSTTSHVLVLELGAGFNTPSVVRWPSEALVNEGEGKIKLVRVNLGHPEIDGVQEKEHARGVRMGSWDFVQSVLGGVDRKA